MLLLTTLLMAMARLGTSKFDQNLHEKYLTMSSSRFVEYYKQLNLSWEITDYSFLDFNFTYNNDFTFFINDYQKLPVQLHDLTAIEPLPANFDARVKWPDCTTIREIYNQQNCESCWAHGVANTASDRICIHKGKTVRLSEQDLECAHDHSTICHKGNPVRGFNYWKYNGIVTRDCKPYTPYDLQRRACINYCQNLYNHNYMYYKDKHFARDVYRIPPIRDQIKAELYLNGPIQAGMYVYQDFGGDSKQGHGYRRGIYTHMYGTAKFGHSVRLIGYGVENGIEYWLAANSWGPMWGENGFFRIRNFQKDVEFEELLISGIPSY